MWLSLLTKRDEAIAHQSPVKPLAVRRQEAGGRWETLKHTLPRLTKSILNIKRLHPPEDLRGAHVQMMEGEIGPEVERKTTVSSLVWVKLSDSEWLKYFFSETVFLHRLHLDFKKLRQDIIAAAASSALITTLTR